MRISKALISVLLLCASSAFAQQSVTDAGAKKPAKKASHVITDDDMSARAPETSHSQSAAPSAASPKASETGNVPASTTAPKGPKSTNPAVAALQNRLDELNSDETNLLNGNQKLEDDIANEEDASRRAVLQNMLTNRKRSLERAKAEKSDINQKIQALNKK